MPRSIKVREDCIQRVRLAVQRNGFLSQLLLAEQAGFSVATVRNFLSGKRVDYATFTELCQTLSLEWSEVAELPGAKRSTLVPQSSACRQIQDWGMAPDGSTFYGRRAELTTLHNWLLAEAGAASPCRLMALVGMGGMGKTALAVKLAKQVQPEFDAVIWRSLRNAPLIYPLLAEIIQVLARQQLGTLPDSFDGQLSLLMQYLRERRCLLVLDNFESLLRSEDASGAYREGYEGYGQLLRCVGETSHSSCVVITSREKPCGFEVRESPDAPVRSLQLTGLPVSESQKLLAAKGFHPHPDHLQILTARYSGNPLALKMVVATIGDMFGGDTALFIDQCLSQGLGLFGTMEILLEQQFSRLSDLETQIMYWLCINREWASPAELHSDIVPAVSLGAILTALSSLQRRSLIDRALIDRALMDGAEPQALNPGTVGFSQPPVVMEYLTHHLLQQLRNELLHSPLDLIHRLALVKAHTKDYLRHAQERIFLQPLAESLLHYFGHREAAKTRLDKLLQGLRQRGETARGSGAAIAAPPSYGAGNLLNLLWRLSIDLSGYDFSGLTLWQVYLQGMPLHGVNLARADLSRTVFTQTRGDILAVAFNPQGTHLAIGIDDDIVIWDLAETRPTLTLQGHSAWVVSVAFSPTTVKEQGSLLASGSNDHTIRLWDTQSGKCLATLQGHRGWVQSVCFSPPRGDRLASASHDQTVRLWDVATGQCLATLRGHTGWVQSVCFGPEGQTLISSSEDQTVKIWNLATGTCQRTIKTAVNWVLSMALSPDGTTLATASEQNTVKFWDIATGDCVGTLPNYTAKVWAVAFSPDGHLLATGSDDQTARLWEVATGQCLKTLRGHHHNVWLVNFCPRGQTLITSSDDQSVKLWEVATGQCLKTLDAYSNRVMAVAFSPVGDASPKENGLTLASGGEDQTLQLWHTESGELRQTLAGHQDLVTSVVFSPQGGMLASGSDDQTIRLWDGQSGQCLGVLQGHQGWVQAIAMAPDGQWLASGSNDQTLKLWDLRHQECLRTCHGHTRAVKTVAVSPCGRWVVSGSDDCTLKLWNSDSGTERLTLGGHDDWVLAVAVSPCGRWVVSGSGDRTLKLWDATAGDCVSTWAGHSDRVRSVAFSPDGTLVASGSEDHTVKLWQVATGSCLQTLQGHEKVVWSVAFSPLPLETSASPSDTLASASEDGTIRLWHVSHRLANTDRGTESGKEAALTVEPGRTLRSNRPYEGMNITGAIGLTPAQRSNLKALGAIEVE